MGERCQKGHAGFSPRNNNATGYFTWVLVCSGRRHHDLSENMLKDAANFTLVNYPWGLKKNRIDQANSKLSRSLFKPEKAFIE